MAMCGKGGRDQGRVSGTSGEVMDRSMDCPRVILTVSKMVCVYSAAGGVSDERGRHCFAFSLARGMHVDIQKVLFCFVHGNAIVNSQGKTLTYAHCAHMRSKLEGPGRLSLPVTTHSFTSHTGHMTQGVNS